MCTCRKLYKTCKDVVNRYILQQYAAAMLPQHICKSCNQTPLAIVLHFNAQISQLSGVSNLCKPVSYCAGLETSQQSP